MNHEETDSDSVGGRGVPYDRYCGVGPPPPTSTSHHGTFTSTTTSLRLSRDSTQPAEGEAGPESVSEGVVQAEIETDASGKKTPAGHGRRDHMAEVRTEDMDRRGRARDRAASHSSSSDDSFDGDVTPAPPPDRQKS